MKVITTFTQTLQAKTLGGSLFLLSIAGACADPSEIGLVLDPGSNQIGVFFEEIPLSGSMVLLDSFNTTSQGALIVGGDESPYFGTTVSTGFSRLSFNPFGTLPNEEAIFDSAVFAMNVVDLIGENFDEEKSFKVHRLTEPILDTVYYNFNSLSYDEEAFASGSFLLQPDTANQLRMGLSADLSAELFEKMTTNHPIFTNIFTFREYFPGIAITGDPKNNVSVVAAIGGGTGMTMYYHYDGDTVSTAYPINTIQSRHFNHVASNRAGTPIEIINQRGLAFEIPGENLGSKANLGLLVKLDMTPLHDFLDTLENITFNQAMFEVGPINEYPEFKSPINNLIMYFSNDEGGFYRRFDGSRVAVQAENQNHTGVGPDGTVVPVSTNPNALSFRSDSSVYVNQVTSYINALYRSGLVKTDLLLYPNRPPSPNAPAGSDAFKRSMREFILQKNQFRLKIYYTRVR